MEHPQMWSYDDGTAWRQNDDGTVFELGRAWSDELVKPDALEGLRLDRLLGARAHGKSSSGSCAADRPGAWFPAEFSHCPACGSEMKSPPVDSPTWKAPFGSLENSRRHEELLVRLDAEAGEACAAPFAEGSPRFLVARLGARLRMLLALDTRDGLVSVWCPDQGQPWRELRSSWNPAELPAWSWSAALDWKEELLVVPDAGGLVALKVNWASSELLRHSLLEGRCIAGPGICTDAPNRPPSQSDLICAPLVNSTGTAVLGWRDQAGHWSTTGISGVVPADECFGQPTRPRRRMLVWPGLKGLLSVTMSPEGRPLAQWRAWPAEEGKRVAGLVDTGPAWRSKDGAVMQAVEEVGGGRRNRDITIKLLRLDNLTESLVLPYGSILTTGAAAFSRAHDHWNRPDEYVATEPPRAELRLPLLQFNQTRDSGVTEPGMALVAHIDPSPDVDIDLLSGSVLQRRDLRAKVSLELSSSHQPPSWLKAPGGVEIGTFGATARRSVWDLRDASLSQIEVCVYDGWLWVHLPQPARLLRWPLLTKSK